MASNTNGYIRNLTEFEQIDQRFARGQLTAVFEYINSLQFPVNIESSNNGYVPEKPDNERNALYQNSDIYLDSGNGRVSTGLRGLELLSVLCKGVDPSNLFLFNNVIYSSNPRAVKTASRDELIQIIINNLGMTTIVQNAIPTAPNEVERFRLLCYAMGYEVRSGVFKKENYKNRVLIAAKRLAVAAARNQTGNTTP